MTLLMGLDVGGGSARCLLLDPDSGEVHTAAAPWDPPRGQEAGDADLEAIWLALARAAREALARAGGRERDVAGIAVTAVRLGAVAIDAEGRALYAGWNDDVRAVEVGFEHAAREGEAWGARVGRWPPPTGLPARLLWLAKERPDVLTRATALIAMNDKIAQRLCGACATDWSQAGETLLLDLHSGQWSAECLDALCISRDLLPEPRASGERLGELRRDAAHALGVTPGIPVAVGGGDTQCALLGAGALEPGDLAVVGGTTAPVQLVLERPRVDPELRLWTGWHVVPGRWVLESNAGPTGLALDWAADLLYPGAPDPVSALLEAARAAPVGADGVRSTLGAHVFDARALMPGLRSLRLSSLALVRAPDGSRGLVARAILEGLIFALRANVEQLRDPGGAQTTEVSLAGGLARSPLIAQLLADTLALPVVAARTHETSALGAALCAGVAAGRFEDLHAAAALAGSGARFDPDPHRARAQEELYASWREILRGE